MLDFYNPLRTYRHDRRLSVKELADALGISRAVMAAIEDGRRSISAEQRDALAAHLRIAPEKLQYLLDIGTG